MARFGIVPKRAFGVRMAALIKLKKEIGRDQKLSLALWASGWFDAKLLAAMIGDPNVVTRGQMNRWALTFENWADCDTACFNLFDRSPHAWAMARRWSGARQEFVRRGGFALMACLALHDKTSPDKPFRAFLPLLERGARDERDLVRKGVSWGLRGIGRRTKSLHTAALAVAKRLAASKDAGARWVGRDVLRELTKKKPRA